MLQDRYIHLPILFPPLADCPAGTMFDGVLKCQNCPLHSYQDQPGQSKCKLCPKNFITESWKAVSINQCKGIFVNSIELK